MSQELYTLIPMISLAMVFFSFSMKIYKRSISSFISILMISISSNLAYYGYIDLASMAVLIFMVVMFYRAMVKPENDSFFIHRYNGEERRNVRTNRGV